MKITILSLISLLLVFGSAGASVTANVAVASATYATTDDNTEVEYSVVTFDVPVIPTDKILSEVILDFYMDVASVLGDDLSGGIATVQVSVMPALDNGKLPILSDAVVASSVVKVGVNRPVRIYITSVVKEAITNKVGELTLLVGSITGDRNGRFETRAIPGGDSTKATVTVYFRDKLDGQALGLE